MTAFVPVITLRCFLSCILQQLSLAFTACKLTQFSCLSHSVVAELYMPILASCYNMDSPFLVIKANTCHCIHDIAFPPDSVGFALPIAKANLTSLCRRCIEAISSSMSPERVSGVGAGKVPFTAPVTAPVTSFLLHISPAYSSFRSLYAFKAHTVQRR